MGEKRGQEMNSWEVIKRKLTEGKKPNTLGMDIEIDKAAYLFILLGNRLKDLKESLESFNNDESVIHVLLNKKTISKLQDSGVL
jgi:hypothetical protein